MARTRAAESLAEELDNKRPGSVSIHQGDLDDDTTPVRV